MVEIKEYKKVEGLDEAWKLNQKRNNKIIGGMMWIRLGHGRINTAIDLSGLGLNQIKETDDEFEIGCMVTLRQLETHEGLNKYTEGCCKEAMRHIVGVQFRNLATVGGSIYGRYGFSDVLTLLLSLDSYVELYKGGIIPLRKYAKMAQDRDIIVNIIVKKKPVKMYYEAVRITETDLPVLTCATARFTERKDRRINVCIGARPARAMIVEDKEEILSEGLSSESIARFAAYAEENVETGSNIRGKAHYRSHLVGILVRRGLENVSK